MSISNSCYDVHSELQCGDLCGWKRGIRFTNKGANKQIKEEKIRLEFGDNRNLN
jgi:hypothetical protein